MMELIPYGLRLTAYGLRCDSSNIHRDVNARETPQRPQPQLEEVPEEFRSAPIHIYMR